MTRTIAITSGKGGVGKTNVSVNMALHLASLDQRVCLFDADLGLANVNVLLGLYPEHNIDEVILKNRSLDEITIKNHRGIDIIPGSSGVEKLANLEDIEINRFIESFAELKKYDFCLFDTSAGISRNVIAFCLAAPEVILVITPEPTSLTDAYALAKVLSWNAFKGQIRVVINQCKSTQIAKQAYNTLKKVVTRNLNVNLLPAGIMMHDPKVVEAVKSQEPFITRFPETTASKCMKVLTDNLMKNQPAQFETNGIVSFWEKCVRIIKSPLQLQAEKEQPRDAVPASPQHITQEEVQKLQSTSEELKQEVPEDKKSERIVGAGESVAIPSEEQTVPEAEKAPAPQPSSPMTADPGIYPLLDKIVHCVTSVSDELSLLRQAIEKKTATFPEIDGKPVEVKQSVSPGAIILDMEAFLKSLSINEKEGQ
jgi:flagellar biosynthesis protein FlhG